MSQLIDLSPIEKELTLVEARLSDNIDSNLDLIERAAKHLLLAGGKRLRPAFALLTAKMYRDDLEEVYPLAVALELVHLATLVHDDVIDNSDIRRGTSTVKKEYGNRISIYSGNYIFARALKLMASYKRSDILEVLADASIKISEGEILQMLSCYNTNLGLKNYLRRIERKTALLIAVSCQLGAMVVNAPPREVEALRLYGYYLGMAFQITDDILDLVADEKVLGKPVGSDIKQGVITLPALYALKYCRNREELARLLSSRESCINKAEQIIDIIVESGGTEYAYEVSRHFINKAQSQLNKMPDSQIIANLFDITETILTRDF
ncbi:MAG: polyprenyl synthetase family protein [Syntrophomonadaceae bacterium]|jgi:heptaprenyl diphosphate synthase